MRKFQTSIGWLAYEISAAEMIHYVQGSKGICDHCNKFAESGFLVLVLNNYVCPECFQKWDCVGWCYPEDQRVEQKNYEYYESLFANDRSCPICGVCYPSHLAHDPRTEEFKKYIQEKYHRRPLWKDVVDQCDAEFQQEFDRELKRAGFKKGLEGEIYYGSSN